MLLEYQAALGQDLAFQHFAQEVEALPGDYAPPTGALLIADDNGERRGMVALRRIDAARAEMKRLFVRPSARRTGLGRALAEHIIAEARILGYRTIVLDTLPSMHQAHALYESLGFQPTTPYYSSPITGTTYLALPL